MSAFEKSPGGGGQDGGAFTPRSGGAQALDEMRCTASSPGMWRSPTPPTPGAVTGDAVHRRHACAASVGTRDPPGSQDAAEAVRQSQALGADQRLAHKVLRTTNISPAALVRSIDENDPPTLILDEADTVFGAKRDHAEGAEDIRGILNAGPSRGWPYTRWERPPASSSWCLLPSPTPPEGSRGALVAGYFTRNWSTNCEARKQGRVRGREEPVMCVTIDSSQRATENKAKEPRAAAAYDAPCELRARMRARQGRGSLCLLAVRWLSPPS